MASLDEIRTFRPESGTSLRRVAILMLLAQLAPAGAGSFIEFEEKIVLQNCHWNLRKHKVLFSESS